MKVFLDANILVTVLNKEYPLFTYAARLLSLQDQERFKLFTSPICLAISFYFAEKKYGTSFAKKKMNLLSENLKITTTGAKEMMQVTQNAMIHDYEDGLEYFSAYNEGCKCIVTEDLNDFYFSEIEVLDTYSFLQKYAIV